MPTKRRRIEPRRINERMPAWAKGLLAGERPERGTPERESYAGWLFFGDEVPGLPDPLSPEGSSLWVPDDAH